jgi:simple sugar transport system ATP-binding protein
LSKRAAIRETEDVAERHGMRLASGRRVDHLAVDERAKAEIVRALYLGARILILDEPTSSLGPRQIDELFAVVRSIAADGISVVLVTHRLSEIAEIASHVGVMRHGKVTAFGETGQFTEADLARAMIGRELPPRAIELSTASPDVARLRVEDLVVRSGDQVMLDGLSFTAAPGRILGIVGVEGNGQAELLEVLAGLRAPDSGSVLVDGDEVTALDPRALHERGLIAISGDRHRWDIVSSMTVTENLGLHRIAHGGYRGKGGLISWGAVEADAARLVSRYDVRPPRTDARLEQLSGGNQQKVVIGRAMEASPHVLVLGHPTRGLDIGARRFIYDQVVAARDAGVAVILFSFDLEELLEHSDDVLVLFRGRIVYRASKADASLEAVGNAMTGVGVAATAGEAG